jgi:hypothetical protein
MATFLRTFHNDGKLVQPGEGGAVQAHPLSLYLPSCTKLCCTLQLSRQIHFPYFFSTPICTLWSQLASSLHRKWIAESLDKLFYFLPPPPPSQTTHPELCQSKVTLVNANPSHSSIFLGSEIKKFLVV